MSTPLPRLVVSLALFGLLAPGLTPRLAEAQGGIGNRLRRSAEQAADRLQGAVVCLASDKKCIEDAEKAGRTVEVRPDGQAPGAAASGADAQRPGQGAWANYDFVPGEVVLFADDFAADNVGDFPRRMEYVDGSAEIVEWQGERWLRLLSDTKWLLVLGDELPRRYTIEFDMIITAGECWLYPDGRQGYDYFVFGRNGVAVTRDGNTPRPVGADVMATPGRHRARVMVDGNYAKLYVDDQRFINLPNFAHQRASQVFLFCDGDETSPTMLKDFRVAAGGRKLYDAIAADGRVATQGIYFDTGSDRVRPESTPTLAEIAAMLKEHPDLQLLIEGHTDNTGQAAANQTLSERRAAAVRQALVEHFAVEGNRLESAGLGATTPVASNTTPEGRQQNRRVELVKR